MKTDKISKKVEKLIAEGDGYEAQGKHDKALKKYRKAQSLDPNAEGLDQRLLDAHEGALDDKEWGKEDFAEHIAMVMDKQEHEYPPIKQTHAKLLPEWKVATDLILKIVREEDDEKAGPLIEELVGHGEIATRALIDLLRTMSHPPVEMDEVT